MTRVICFELSGKLGHFLKAEAGASALSYPVPPRTVLMGIIGAMLGIEKDHPQIALETIQIAVSGKYPLTHWHRVKLRKDPPEALSFTIKASQKEEKTTKPEKASLVLQEWLFKPSYTVMTVLPDTYHDEFERRLKERHWYYQPSLGLTEMMAGISYIDTLEAEPLPYGIYDVNTVVGSGQGQLDLSQVYQNELSIFMLNMPRAVTAERVFTHAAYFMEKNAHPMPVKTEHAYRVGDKVLMFL